MTIRLAAWAFFSLHWCCALVQVLFVLYVLSTQAHGRGRWHPVAQRCSVPTHRQEKTETQTKRQTARSSQLYTLPGQLLLCPSCPFYKSTPSACSSLAPTRRSTG